MKRWRNKLLLLGGVAALAAAIPAIGQESPESLLPPGFGDPDAPLPPPETVVDPAAPGEAEEPAPSDRPSAPRRQTMPVEEISPEELEALLALEIPPPIEIPDESRRPTDVVGVLDESGWGLGYDAYGSANGRFLTTLMRRLDAPVPSRWASIVLRRALLSRAPAPRFVNPVDWVAERAWLLVRMGEADGARMLVQSVDVDQFTPKMFIVAVQAALATADPAALCPLIEPGRKTSDEPVWALGDAMCHALEGEPAEASQLIGQARRRRRAPDIDVTLAEKVIGAGANTRRAVTVQWDEVDEINSWRFGLASATGAAIPDRLMNNAGAHVRAWYARAPMVPLEQRLSAAYTAASLGVFSNASLVEIYSQIADTIEPSELADTPSGRLRAAYVARSLDDRMTALREIWEEAGTDERQRHARHILTATAAARIAPSEALAADADDLIASMLSAGYDTRAARWAAVVEALEGGEAADRAWGMLALASPSPSVEIGTGRIETFGGNDGSEDKVRTRLLIAALAGLGRIDEDAQAQLGEDYGINFAGENRWTKMLDRAVQNRQPGSVALLAGVGMQTGGWAGVPPEHLYRIVRALRMVGQEYEARMIAAEAVARL